jgi:pimeloyl-ACP methyl ester carboxylesterase
VAGNVEAFFFGEPGGQLFGCHHPPNSGASAAGAVLCYPMGQEYLRTHRLFRFLARRLSDAGLHVLRFDYFGTGDSAGEFEAARLERWVDDTVTAVAELRRRFLVRRVYAAGLRLGAAIAYRAAVKQGGVDGLVLWDPVANGPEYLADIIYQETQQLYSSLSKDAGSAAGARRPPEIVGFPMTEAMYEDLAALDLFGITRMPAPRTLLLDSSDGAVQEKLRAHIESAGTLLRFEHIPHPTTWTQDPYKTVVPTKIIDSVGGWISERP